MKLLRRIYVWHVLKETIPLIHLILKQWLDICQHNIPTTRPLINVEAKREIKGRAMTRNLKIRIVTRVALTVHMLKIL